MPPVPKHKFTNPLKLKSVLIPDDCIGYDGLITNVVKTHAMERIELDCLEMFNSSEKFSEFIASLPQTGSQLKSLIVPLEFELDRESLDCIFESCVNLEELDIHHPFASDPSLADYLSNKKLRSMKELKCLSIGGVNYHEMIAKEMPQLIRPEIKYFHVPRWDLTMGHSKQVEFLSPTIH